MECSDVFDVVLSICDEYHLYYNCITVDGGIGNFEFRPIWILFFNSEESFRLIIRIIVDLCLLPYVSYQWVDDLILEILYHGLDWIS